MIRELFFWGGGLLAVVLAALAVYSIWVSQPLFEERLDPKTLDTLRIAPPETALSFARVAESGRLRLLLVTHYENGKLTGVDAQQYFGEGANDPITLYATLGYDALQRALQSDAPRITADAATLGLPFDPVAANIGIGASYAEHAREAHVAEQPFVFPKLVRPTQADAEVPQGDSRLMDYEAELGFVALEDIRADSPPPARMGLVLGNDFTDRWSLVMNFRRGHEMGTTGFVEGKSREGYAPIGNLFVIPRDLQSFYRDVELRLYVNGRLRQRASASQMVWGPAALLKGIFARENWRFLRESRTVPLLARQATIPQRTLIFSGTPAGVIFKPVNLWNRWLYLQPGDEVIMRSDMLGLLRNRVTAGPRP